MLKTVALVLVIVGLVDQIRAATIGMSDQSSATSDLTTLDDNGIAMPGFSWTPNRFIQVNATKGTLQAYNTFSNSSAWIPLIGVGYSAISQNISFPKMSALYDKTDGWIFPFVLASGPLSANLKKSVLNLTFNATGGSDCNLKISVDLLDLVLDLDLSKLGMLFRAIKPLLKGLEATVAASLKNALPAALTAFESQDLPRKLDLETLCLELLASDKENYPEPTIN